MRFEDDIDDAELLALMDAPTVPRSAGDGSRPSLAKPAAEAPAVATVPPAVDPALASSLTATLKKFFGHDAFRAGQLDVVAAAVSGRDAAVYWSTGSGKSMCYQIPALHTGKTTLVVSPLVSLMQDQVTHLNNTAGEGNVELAAFLGSAQTDASVQERALRGEFRVLYVTPEKLVGFVDDDDENAKNAHNRATNEHATTTRDADVLRFSPSRDGGQKNAMLNRGGRGALRVAVGPRFPRRVPRAGRAENFSISE
jgi:hypothetical protein